MMKGQAPKAGQGVGGLSVLSRLCGLDGTQAVDGCPLTRVMVFISYFGGRG